ncbi:MAG: hypothetical protein ABR509_05995 [Candidatus Limnocylindria bacterium]
MRSGFLGAPVAKRLDVVPSGAVAVLGVPFGVRYPRQTHDCSGAPTAIRERSQRFAPFVRHFDFDIGGSMLGDGSRALVDQGDVADGESSTDAVAQRGTIAGATITELVPDRDVNGLSAVAVVRLVMLLVGAMARSDAVAGSL